MFMHPRIKIQEMKLNMLDSEKKEHAKRIAEEHLGDFEFLNVVEDEELEDTSEDDLLDIHTLITKSTVVIN